MARNAPPTALARSEWLAGRYELLRELGRGSEGRVLLAIDHAAGDEPRAIKLVPEHEAERVRWEFSLLSRIAHPNLARVYELVRAEQAVPKLSLPRGALALVSEVAPGLPADAVARTRANDREALLELAWLVLDRGARALAAVHAQGFVHGDVKPANVIVSDDASDAKLIDLGLARAPGFEPRLSGTPGFLAPELFRGELTAAADSYALGACVWRLLAPSHDSAGSTSAERELARALVDARVADPLPSWVPERMARLLGELRALDPAARPLPAHGLLRRIAELAPEARRDTRGSTAARAAREAAESDAPSAAERALSASRLPLTGRGEALEALVSALQSQELVIVSGVAGSGRSRLVREAVGRVQTLRAADGGVLPTYRVQESLSADTTLAASIVHVQRGDAVELAEAHALLRSARVAGERGVLVLERSERVSDPAATNVELAPLGVTELESLLVAALPEVAIKAPLVREAAAISGGLPGRLCRTLAAAFLAGDDPSRAGVLRNHAQGDGASAGLPGSVRPLAELLALAGGALGQPAAAAGLGDPERVALQARQLSALGACTRGEHGELVLRPDLAEALRAALSAAQRKALAARVPEVLAQGRAGGFLAHAAGEIARAEAAFAAECEAALRRGAPEHALRLADEASALLAGTAGKSPSASLALPLLAADALRALGRYDAALARLDSGDVRSAGVRAELLRLCGRAKDARATIERTQHDASATESVRAACEVVGARLALDAGDAEGALQRAERVLQSGSADDVVLRASEVSALAALALGHTAQARARCDEALALARTRGKRAAEARLCSVSASIHRARGEGQTARREFARAHELADAAGEQHAAASFLVNLGTAQLDAGELGPALQACREGARRLARLGRERDLARVLYNLAFASHLVGDDDAALAALEHAGPAARSAGDVAAEAFAAVLRAEVLVTRDREAAGRALREMPALDRVATSERASLAARSSSVWIELGEVASAQALLQEARAQLPADLLAAADAELSLADTALARARKDAREASRCAELALAQARTREELGVELLALLAAARAAEESSEVALARTRYAEVRSRLDAAALTLLPADRMRLREVRAYRAALAALPSASVATQTTASAERWRRLAALAKRLSAPQRPARLYEIVLDAALDLSGAERCYLLWNDADGVPRVRAGRGLGARDLSADHVSRSIVERVIATGQPLSTVDASSDARLSNAASVHALSLRSVLAVPIRAPREVRGALYLDDRLRPFAFGEEEVALLSDLADLAAIALESSELLRRERRAVRRLHVARERLARRVEAQALELSALREVGERAESYPGIVAHSAPMQDAMKLALRVARADVPVLLRGESGTGKELVAKAIHAESLRKDRPFVTENCGAIPETLLESALFGHVKGAFTGAERRRLGLFEVADGGTLFLDEIGEMTPSMQARLLRVLQDGEIRAVGAERSTRVDVRVIAATHRDLEAMVKQGAFREDLYYRLAVVSITLPPLRDRADDIAPLVAHFVAKHAKGRKLRVDRRALERLRSESWPGNVRQLENEVRRALVLADDVIREENFSFGAAAPDREHDARNGGGDLDLRMQVDALERRLIKRALETAKNNQTKAAELLGVSRFGLQKMQKRLGLS